MNAALPDDWSPAEVRPVVTVLIPTYRRKELLPDAIRSALGQTFTEIEILVLDDCSPDGTRDAVAPFLADSRVRYLRHEKNLGIADNWRCGISAARGEYFCILHDDDTLDPSFISRLLAPLVADESLILAFCDHWVTDPQGRRSEERSRATTHGYGRDVLVPGRLRDFAATALVQNAIPVGATLFRRSAVSPDFVDTRARGSIDMWLLYRCVQTGLGAHYLPERLMNYREHTGGMSKSMPFEMIEGHLFRFREMLRDQELASLHPALSLMLKEALEWHGMALLAAKRNRAAGDSFWEAMRLKCSLKACFGLVLSRLGKMTPRVLDLSKKMLAPVRA